MVEPTKDELIEAARSKDLPTSGTKQDLEERLETATGDVVVPDASEVAHEPTLAAEARDRQAELQGRNLQ